MSWNFEQIRDGEIVYFDNEKIIAIEVLPLYLINDRAQEHKINGVCRLSFHSFYK